MGGEWKRVAIGSVGRVVTGRTPPGTRPEHFGSHTPFLTPTDMDGRRRIETTSRWLSEEGARVLERIVVPHGVAVSCIGWQMGKAILIDRPVATNQQINTVIPDARVANDLFLYYALTAKRSEIFNLGAGGSRTPILSKSEFEKLTVLLPPVTQQEAIAHILGTLDDKIELNRRMNETLEAMARAIFQSWFVDFAPVRAKMDGRKPEGMDAATAKLFPDGFEDSELGPIPRGWQVGSLLEQAALLSGGTPKTSEKAYWDGDIPWASAKDVSQCGQPFLISTERTITQRGLEESATKLIESYSTVVVARGATTGRLAMLGSVIAMNQTCYALRSKYESHFALYCQLRAVIDSLVHSAHGSVFDTITTSTFESSPILLPDTRVLHAFERIVTPVFMRILANERQIEALVAIRDALLPKLISGNYDVEQLGTLAKEG